MSRKSRRVLRQVAWRVAAFKEVDSAVFATELEKHLNDMAEQGYTLQQMLPRHVDNAMVVVHQKLVETVIEDEVKGTN